MPSVAAQYLKVQESVRISPFDTLYTIRNEWDGLSRKRRFVLCCPRLTTLFRVEMALILDEVDLPFCGDDMNSEV